MPVSTGEFVNAFEAMKAKGAEIATTAFPDGQVPESLLKEDKQSLVSAEDITKIGTAGALVAGNVLGLAANAEAAVTTTNTQVAYSADRIPGPRQAPDIEVGPYRDTLRPEKTSGGPAADTNRPLHYELDKQGANAAAPNGQKAAPKPKHDQSKNVDIVHPKAGEGLGQIAAADDTTLAKLEDMNPDLQRGTNDFNLLFKTDKVREPARGDQDSGNARHIETVEEHITLKDGQSDWDIAQKIVSEEEAAGIKQHPSVTREDELIVAANPGKDPNRELPGTVINAPEKVIKNGEAGKHEKHEEKDVTIEYGQTVSGQALKLNQLWDEDYKKAWMKANDGIDPDHVLAGKTYKFPILDKAKAEHHPAPDPHHHVKHQPATHHKEHHPGHPKPQHPTHHRHVSVQGHGRKHRVTAHEVLHHPHQAAHVKLEIHNYQGNTWSKEQLQHIEKLAPIYMEAAAKYGIPWQMLPAVHMREHGLAVSNPDNGQGPYQRFSTGHYFKPGPISMQDFKRQTMSAAKALAEGYASRSNSVVQGHLAFDKSTSLEKVAWTFYAYNGMAYGEQAKEIGYDSPQLAFEGSPYVMNLASPQQNSEHNSGWGQIVTDNGDMSTANQVPGAMLYFRDLVNVTPGADHINNTDLVQNETAQTAPVIVTPTPEGNGSGSETSQQTGEDLANTAWSLAWHDTGHGANYADATPAYQQALLQYDSGADTSETSATACNAFIATVVHDAGYDKDFSEGPTGTMLQYLQHSSKWELAGSAPDLIENNGLHQGDILIVNNYDTNQGHVMMYVGDQGGFNAVSASLDDHVPEASNVYGSLYGLDFQVFRPVGDPAPVLSAQQEHLTLHPKGYSAAQRELDRYPYSKAHVTIDGERMLSKHINDAERRHKIAETLARVKLSPEGYQQFKDKLIDLTNVVPEKFPDFNGSENGVGHLAPTDLDHLVWHYTAMPDSTRHLGGVAFARSMWKQQADVGIQVNIQGDGTTSELTDDLTNQVLGFDGQDFNSHVWGQEIDGAEQASIDPAEYEAGIYNSVRVLELRGVTKTESITPIVNDFIKGHRELDNSTAEHDDFPSIVMDPVRAQIIDFMVNQLGYTR